MSDRVRENKDTVLLVDDEPQCLDWLVDYIVAKGYSIVTATTLEAALDLLRENRYRLVICDLSIPAPKNTLSFLQKENPAYALYPSAYIAHFARNLGHRARQVLVYSVHESQEIRDVAELLGVVYMTKGRPTQFKREIDSILSYDPTAIPKNPPKKSK